jgi:DNA-binding NtrC family response regulator
MKTEKVRILLVDDEPMMADSLRQNLIDEGYSVDVATTGAQAIERFDQGTHQIVICDLVLPDTDGLEVMRHIKDARPTSEVIMVTGYGSIAKAVDATKAGAFYFVEKPFEFEEIQLLIDKALEHNQLVVETASMRRQLSTRSEYFNIIGGSKKMQTIYETIEAVAKSDANVLIVGESGTGKELIANAIHYNSLRSKQPFIKVNCAALPKELIESELFGHTKGAFTGAHSEKEGLVQHAAGGSLLLDEIGEMPVELQPKLLRVLQERSYRKIGSEKTYAVDFRLVTSTNRVPAEAIRDGSLRDDLFYRISTITISVPPLRERNEDVQLLAEHFLTLYSTKYERPITGLTAAAYRRLFEHQFPGNVRELQNMMERAVLLAKGSKIDSIDLALDKAAAVREEGTNTGWEIPANMTLEEMERLLIESTLKRTGGNKRAAANLLGIYRPRLYSKIKRYNIDPEMLNPA